MTDMSATLRDHLRQLKLPSFQSSWQELARTAEQEGWPYGRFLYALTELEVDERRQRRTERHLRQSRLPSDKTLETLDLERLPLRVRRALPRLCRGGFTERGDNLLLFGLPGRGKTHVACAIGHELVRGGHRVLFSQTSLFVQRLLAAKQELALERLLKRLDRFDAVILDDLGYVQQDRAEMEVLFTFLAERYERRSVILTSNLVFSEWERIFKDPMTTAAAIDRLVHHSVILELTGTSYRTDAAKGRLDGDEDASPAEPNASTDNPADVVRDNHNPGAF